MPDDAPDTTSPTPSSQKPKSSLPSQRAEQKPWLTTPAPIKRLFDKFPLRTYPPNQLPQQLDPGDSGHVLYIFTTSEGAKTGAPSFNPSCLKWQAYLKFMNFTFVTTPSNNHASPTGALPFLSTFKLPLDPLQPPTVVPSTNLSRWVQSHDFARTEPESMRYEAYMSLLDHRIRHAWLYTLYLTPSNSHSVAERLYIDPTSNNPFVRRTLAYQLRQAAQTELLKHSAVIDVEALFREAGRAWEALSRLLGEDEYFFEQERPGLFDASVFAYTHLLLDEGLGWVDTRMRDGLRGCRSLVEHRERLLRRYF